MIRTFVAAEIPDALKIRLGKEISRLAQIAPGVKWALPDNLHLTFAFLGDVRENDLGEIFAAVQEAVIDFPPFLLEVRGIGAFPNWRHPRVVWAGCGEGGEEVTDLGAAIQEICRELGFEIDKRPYRPHFTLGRIKRPADAIGLAEAVQSMATTSFGQLDVDEVAIFMSSLRRTGPVYSPMARLALGG